MVKPRLELLRTMNFPNKLASLMRQQGFTQTSLGQRIGVSQKAVSKWLAGDSRPGPETALKLAELFHVSVEVLLSRTEPLAFDKALADIRADRERVEVAYPGNAAAQQHGLDYLQQNRMIKREAERLRGLILELAQVVTVLDPSDELLVRLHGELSASMKLAELKRRAATGEAQNMPAEDRGHVAS